MYPVLSLWVNLALPSTVFPSESDYSVPLTESGCILTESGCIQYCCSDRIYLVISSIVILSESALSDSYYKESGYIHFVIPI